MAGAQVVRDTVKERILAFILRAIRGQGEKFKYWGDIQMKNQKCILTTL